jgi:hypothetical protein
MGWRVAAMHGIGGDDAAHGPSANDELLGHAASDGAVGLSAVRLENPGAREQRLIVVRYQRSSGKLLHGNRSNQDDVECHRKSIH